MAAVLSRRALTKRTPFVCSSCLSRSQHRSQSTEAVSSAALSSTTMLNGELLAPRSTKGIIPKPTPWVPDVATFFKLIGRELSQHTSKFQSWDELFTLSSAQLKARGLENTRTRRYLLRWIDKFRRNEFGVGGDFQHVQDGVAQLRVCEIPSLPRKYQTTAKDSASQSSPKATPKIFASTSHTPGLTRLILNVPFGSDTYALLPGQKTTDLKKPAGFKLKEGHIITGAYALPIKGTNGMGATIKITEGMWEHKRGKKINGGERRRTETEHKMRVAENKKANR